MIDNNIILLPPDRLIKVRVGTWEATPEKISAMEPACDSISLVAAASPITSVLATFTVAKSAVVRLYKSVVNRAGDPANVKGPADSYQFLTTVALARFIITHTHPNASVITMFHRLREKHNSVQLMKVCTGDACCVSSPIHERYNKMRLC